MSKNQKQHSAGSKQSGEGRWWPGSLASCFKDAGQVWQAPAGKLGSCRRHGMIPWMFGRFGLQTIGKTMQPPSKLAIGLCQTVSHLQWITHHDPSIHCWADLSSVLGLPLRWSQGHLQGGWPRGAAPSAAPSGAEAKTPSSAHGEVDEGSIAAWHGEIGWFGWFGWDMWENLASRMLIRGAFRCLWHAMVQCQQCPIFWGGNKGSSCQTIRRGSRNWEGYTMLHLGATCGDGCKFLSPLQWPI